MACLIQKCLSIRRLSFYSLAISRVLRISITITLGMNVLYLCNKKNKDDMGWKKKKKKKSRLHPTYTQVIKQILSMPGGIVQWHRIEQFLGNICLAMIKKELHVYNTLWNRSKSYPLDYFIHLWSVIDIVSLSIPDYVTF